MLINCTNSIIIINDKINDIYVRLLTIYNEIVSESNDTNNEHENNSNNCLKDGFNTFNVNFNDKQFTLCFIKKTNNNKFDTLALNAGKKIVRTIYNIDGNLVYTKIIGEDTEETGEVEDKGAPNIIDNTFFTKRLLFR